MMVITYEDKRQRQKGTHRARSRSLERSCSVAARAARARCERSDDVRQALHLHHVFLHEGAVLGATVRAQRGRLELKSSIKASLTLRQDTPKQ